MVDNKYAVAYSEILEILKYIPKDDWNATETKAFIINPVEMALNNLYLVNNEVCRLYQAVNKPANELRNTTHNEVFKEKIFSTTA